MTVCSSRIFLTIAGLLALAMCTQATVITVTPVQKLTDVGVEPAEWECTNGWSIVTNKMGVGRIMASGPSFCEAPYQPFVAYELENVAGDVFPRWVYVKDQAGNPIPKYDMGRGAFYASCDSHYGQNPSPDNNYSGKTPSTVWLGTDQHAGQPLPGVALRQIKTAKYCSFVSRNPTLLAPGIADSGWSSYKQAWYNPRHPIQLQFFVRHPTNPDPSLYMQFWYRPWGSDPFIGDCASDGRLGIWEELIAIGPGNTGKWLSPNYWEGNPTRAFNSWDEVLNSYHPSDPQHVPFKDYVLMDTSTSYPWKSPGYKGATDPPGMPMCTGTGKCLNFEVGARFWRFILPTGEQRTWYPESVGFRGQIDHFVLEIDRNEDGDVNDPGESAVYDFEPPADDPGPRIVYLNQRALDPRNQLDTLMEKLGEPDNKYDPMQNPLKDTKDARLYDVLYKISGRVTDKLNPWFTLDDGANLVDPSTGLPLHTMVWTLDEPSPSTWIPYNYANPGEYWTSWGFLERFRATGSPPFVLKPFIMWTSKRHDEMVSEP
ncbi:MAG: hypothetical protein ACP5R5_00785 [Armatimonadota bacterium]